MQDLRKAAAAEVLGVDRSTIDRYVKAGRLHPIYPYKGSEPYFAQWELRRLLGGTSEMPRREYSSLVWSVLTCPHCRESLCQVQEGARCPGCSTEYGYSNNGALDLRPKQEVVTRMEFRIQPAGESPLSYNITPGGMSGSEVITLTGDAVKQWYRDHWPKRPAKPSIGLELGTSDVLQREALESSGFEYLGVDYDSTHALMLVEAHALPFRDDSIPFIMAYAFLEHLQYPAVAMREAFRILQPGGKLIGTVSFLEPFHMNSFYHHTHLGVISTLKSAGFDNISVVPSDSWSGLLAMGNMALFPGAKQWLVKAVFAPAMLLHRLWWRSLRRFHPEYTEGARVRNTTGAFSFCCSKPTAR